MFKPDICIHHMPCLDGFAAAWAIWNRWPDVEFVGAAYGDAPPDVTDKNVLIVDFSYKADVLSRMAVSARSITVIDHHESAERDLEPWKTHRPDLKLLMSPGNLEARADESTDLNLALPIQAVFDMNRSGAALAWDFAFPEHAGNPPALIRHVEDRDLWRFKHPDTKAVIAALASYEYDFDDWSRFASHLDSHTGRQDIVSEGVGIMRRMDREMTKLIEETRREMVIGGVRVPTANIPYFMGSEAGSVLGLGAPFAAVYYDTPKGRKFSLRVREGDANVSLIAAKYGGGGHAKASGFTMPLGWEGDE